MKHRTKKITEQKFMDRLIKNSGINIKKSSLIKVLTTSSIMIGFIAMMIIEIILYNLKLNSYSGLITLIISAPVIFAISFAILYGTVLISLSLIAAKRTKKIEQSLPSFLELASNNISAGMSIDKALWFAVRPNFGILAKEIEIVAKKVMNGYDLSTALKEFSDKYNSKLLKRSILLLIEGLKAGGEIGSLLNKISENITQTKILKKEISASVTSYVIFILFASVIIAPLLFGLSTGIMKMIKTILTKIVSPGASSSMSGSALSVKIPSASNITSDGDFLFFALLTLTISSFFTALIISNMKKGDSQDVIKLFPTYLIITYLLFFAAKFVVEFLFNSLF